MPLVPHCLQLVSAVRSTLQTVQGGMYERCETRADVAFALLAWTAAAVLLRTHRGTFRAGCSTKARLPFLAASVTATNPATGFNRATITDDEGVYRLTALPVGMYEIKVRARRLPDPQPSGRGAGRRQHRASTSTMAMQTLSENVQVQASYARSSRPRPPRSAASSTRSASR